MPSVRPRIWLSAVVLLVLLAVTAVVAIRAVAATADPTEEKLLRDAGLGEMLYVGVSGTEPGISEYDPRTGIWSGFDVEIARMIAAELRFQETDVVFCKVRVEDRGRGWAKDCPGRPGHTVDLVVAAYSITTKRMQEEGIMFGGPYLTTTTSVITRTGHRPVNVLADLKGERVCVAGTATSESPLVQAGADVRPEADTDECVKALLTAKTVAAVSTDTAILAGFVARHPREVVHHDISSVTDEKWGVNVLRNEPLRTLVDLALERSRTCVRDKTWETAFRQSFSEKLVTLIGQPVATSEQPEVMRRPRVREWPWQRERCG